MEMGAAELSRGKDVASRAGTSLEEIVQVVRQVDDMAKEIYSLTRQQAADNRERKRAPKRGRSWCPACDRAQVSDGQRCPRCGRRKLPRRAKR